ncbi:hypothetical protein ACTXT7_011752 [Hymenolepis weldensis]
MPKTLSLVEFLEGEFQWRNLLYSRAVWIPREMMRGENLENLPSESPQRMLHYTFNVIEDKSTNSKHNEGTFMEGDYEFSDADDD